MTPLLLLLVGAVLGLWWHTSIEARDQANHAALKACESAGAQLLDGTVSFKSFRFARNDHGQLALRRTYVFDYTEDGEGRRHGFVILRGREVELVGLGPTLVQGNAA